MTTAFDASRPPASRPLGRQLDEIGMTEVVPDRMGPTPSDDHLNDCFQGSVNYFAVYKYIFWFNVLV